MAGCATQPAPGTSKAAAAALNYEGLEQVTSRRFDVVQVRPGADFSRYGAVLFSELELAYRTPDQARQQFPLTQEQRDGFRTLLVDVFTAEIASMASPRLASEPGPDVLEISVRLQDITATVPPRAVGPVGRTSIALRAVGDVTLVIELSDSQSNELLGRVVDSRAVEGVAIASGGEMVTRWEDVERLARRWSAILRQGLEELLGS